MTDKELRIFGTRLKKAKREIVGLRGPEADQRKRYFQIIRSLANLCVDDQGRVPWDFLEAALSEDAPTKLIPRNADGT
jgi:hypothetical protein